MKNYRLKKEAVPFFKEKHATKIYPLETWESLQVSTNALEEVEDAFVEYGQSSGEKCSRLSGWNKENGQELYFTLKFPSMNYKEHDEFTKGEMIRDLMNSIQNQVNYFYQKFNNDRTR